VDEHNKRARACIGAAGVARRFEDALPRPHLSSATNKWADVHSFILAHYCGAAENPAPGDSAGPMQGDTSIARMRGRTA
jgi:hypothetical protein